MGFPSDEARDLDGLERLDSGELPGRFTEPDYNLL